MNFVKNNFTGNDIFYHSSKNGLNGKISPNKNDKHKKRDFGDGFYLGSKKKQTIALVNSCPNAKLYEIQIPLDLLNENNTLILSKNDWMFFVLYNRGYLEKIKDTEFYNYYKHLADNKQFIIGNIADDVFTTCMKDFVKGSITDYVFMKLIDCYSYGIQIVAKTEEACRQLNNHIIKEKNLSSEDRLDALNSRKLNREQQEKDYEIRKAKLLRESFKEHKGKFIDDIFEDIKIGKILPSTIDSVNVTNIKFDSNIIDEEEKDYDEYEFFL